MTNSHGTEFLPHESIYFSSPKYGNKNVASSRVVGKVSYFKGPYRRKEKIIKAIFYDGKNIKEIEEFVGKKLRITPITLFDIALEISSRKTFTGDYIRLLPMQWLVDEEDLEYTTFSDIDFKNIFESTKGE